MPYITYRERFQRITNHHSQWESAQFSPLKTRCDLHVPQHKKAKSLRMRNPYGDISMVADFKGIGVALQSFFSNLDDRLVALEQHEELDEKRWMDQQSASAHLDEAITCLTKSLSKQSIDPDVICALSHLQKMQECISSNIDSKNG
jgi:hypothetical protein